MIATILLKSSKMTSGLPALDRAPDQTGSSRSRSVARRAAGSLALVFFGTHLPTTYEAVTKLFRPLRGLAFHPLLPNSLRCGLRSSARFTRFSRPRFLSRFTTLSFVTASYVVG